MIDKKKPVSVIIPSYNRGWVIQEAIDSVLNQTYRNFELIVVDDGSTDNTVKILSSYGDKITVIRQENKGVSAARNRGIKKASGHLIAFLDSDDLWLPKKLDRQVEYFYSNPDALICQTEEIWIKNHVRVNPKRRHKKLSGMIFKPSLSLCLVSPSAVMIDKRLFEIAGLFDERLPACEDYDLWLRISCRYPVYLIDTPLIIKRGGHSDQLSARSGLDKFRIMALKNIIENNFLSKDQRSAAVKTLKEKCAVYAGGCRKRERHQEALYYISLSERF